MYKRSVTCFISKLYLILPSDIVRIKELTMILKIISQYDVKYVMVLPIKTITSVLKVLTYIITSITKTLCQVSFEGFNLHYHWYH